MLPGQSGYGGQSTFLPLMVVSWYGQVVEVRVSHYLPNLGGPNCSNFVNGVCVSHTASGAPWEDWVDKGAACIPEWAFGTQFTLPDGRTFTCVDRGGAIRKGYKYNDGLPWVDLLTASPNYPFGSIVKVKVKE
jgi:hypothetical protein